MKYEALREPGFSPSLSLPSSPPPLSLSLSLYRARANKGIEAAALALAMALFLSFLYSFLFFSRLLSLSVSLSLFFSPRAPFSLLSFALSFRARASVKKRGYAEAKMQMGDRPRGSRQGVDFSIDRLACGIKKKCVLGEKITKKRKVYGRKIFKELNYD